MTDEELWRRASAGDPYAFGDLFERHARTIYNFCFRSTGQWAAAEDLVSATFLQAWRRRHEVRFPGSSALPFLYGVATNLIRNHARGARRRHAALSRLPRAGQPIPDPADDVAGRLDDQRLMSEVLDRIKSLSVVEREVFTLCVWQGLSYEEAAMVLAVLVGMVCSWFSRARSRLRLGRFDRVEGGGSGRSPEGDADQTREES